MEKKHTLETWCAVKNKIVAQWHAIASINSHDTSEGNARLIAAAQELLDAMQSAERWFIDYGDTEQAGYEAELRNIRSAINKAKVRS